MSNTLKLEFNGLDELLGKLKEAANLTDVKNAVKLNAREMTARAIRGAPRDTGHLRRSIQVDITGGGFVGKTEARANYSGYINYGTRYMASRPFLTNAFYTQRDIFLKDLKRLMR